MGYRISWLGARVPASRLLEAVGLTATDQPDEANESRFSVAELPTGWSIIWSNDEEWATLERVPTLSATVPTIAGMVDETIMVAFTDYADPTTRWFVQYGLEEDGVLAGSWPETLEPVIATARHRQAGESDDPDDSIDHVFEVPVEAGRIATGWRYDEAVFDWGRPVFMVAVPSAARA